MHLAFLHSDIRLFSSKHSLTSVDRCDRKRRLDQNVFFVLQFRLYACLLSYQCRSCGTGPAYIHQSSHTCNPPEPGHTDRSHSRSVFRTPLLANPQKLCMDLNHVKHSVSLNIREDTIPGWKQLPSMAQVIHYMDESTGLTITFFWSIIKVNFWAFQLQMEELICEDVMKVNIDKTILSCSTILYFC